MIFKAKAKETGRFALGDLVYDEFYGRGLVVDFDRKFDEMEVSFKNGAVWLITRSVGSLRIVSRAKDRQKVLDKILTP
jgi:heat shock protein HspQ